MADAQNPTESGNETEEITSSLGEFEMEEGFEHSDPAPEIEIVADGATEEKPKEAPAGATDDDLSAYDGEVQARIKAVQEEREKIAKERDALTRQVDQLRTEREAAVRAQAASQQELSKSHQAMLEQAKKSAEADIVRAREVLRSAKDSGDVEAEMKAEEVLAEARGIQQQIRMIEMGGLQPGANTLQNNPNLQQGAATSQESPQVDAKMQSWASRNPWFGQDKSATAYAYQYHDVLAAEGSVAVGSDDYYARIDAEMQKRFPELFSGMSQTPQQKSVVAPVQRTGKKTTVRLTPLQIKFARTLGLTPKQYAEQIAKEEDQKAMLAAM